jgi:hypothetical protein
MSSIHTAAKFGDAAAMAECLARGNDPNAVSVRHNTLLLLAAEGGYLPVVRMLLVAGADANRGRGETTPLHLAARGGHLRVVEALIAAGAAVDPVDGFLRTPAMEAAANGQAEVVHHLLERGADPSRCDHFGLRMADWLEDGGHRAREVLFGPAARSHRPEHLARAAGEVGKMMADHPEPEQFAAVHGRLTVVWSYGHYPFEDPAVRGWATKVSQILFNPELLAAAEERWLTGDELEQARQLRQDQVATESRRARWRRRQELRRG